MGESNVWLRLSFSTPYKSIGNPVYDSETCYATVAARGATLSIPPRQGTAHGPANTAGATWRNDAVDEIARLDHREWKKVSDDHRRALAENAMYRLKILASNRSVRRLACN